MDRRLKLHKEIKEQTGIQNVYFKPPASKRMEYPCIKYELGDKRGFSANDKKYLSFIAYTVTIIDRDPDSKIPEKLENAFMYCEFDRSFTTDELNHWVYTLYY